MRRLISLQLRVCSCWLIGNAGWDRQWLLLLWRSDRWVALCIATKHVASRRFPGPAQAYATGSLGRRSLTDICCRNRTPIPNTQTAAHKHKHTHATNQARPRVTNLPPHNQTCSSSQTTNPNFAGQGRCPVVSICVIVVVVIVIGMAVRWGMREHEGQHVVTAKNIGPEAGLLQAK